jgi:hypothetical protein
MKGKIKKGDIVVRTKSYINGIDRQTIGTMHACFKEADSVYSNACYWRNDISMSGNSYRMATSNEIMHFKRGARHIDDIQTFDYYKIWF